MRKHENYRELVWMLAKTDFKLRYHGSILGYVWALLKPLLMFAILNFVFSSIFNPRGVGSEFYSLQLITSIMMFNFFAEGTSAGMASLLNKSQLVTKIYIPRWTIILASTLNSALIYLMNLLIIAGFFLYKGFYPSLTALGMFLLFSCVIYLLVVSFAFITAPLFVKFRDLSMIWEVLTQILFYATPIVYPLTMMPLNVQQILLLNPIAFVIHFTKESLINNHFADPWQNATFLLLVALLFALSLISYKKFSRNVAEEI
jgi:ABC-type polysaccharide/polyol phosphate export permease